MIAVYVRGMAGVGEASWRNASSRASSCLWKSRKTSSLIGLLVVSVIVALVVLLVVVFFTGYCIGVLLCPGVFTALLFQTVHLAGFS
jgi:hypothetical protein